MTNKSDPAEIQPQSSQTLHAIHEKMVKDSWNLAIKMALSIEREGKKRKNADKTS